MSRFPRRRRTAALLAAAIAGTGLAMLSAAPAQAVPIEVDDAQFRWGFNNESNNRGFAPGTFNFFSAGKLTDPGQGYQTLNGANQGATWSNGKPAGWSAENGNVRIEKKKADGSFARATWAGLSTDANGQSIPNPASGKYSGHEVATSNGTGTLDPETDSGTIQWDGDFTVVYYSGMTFWYASDPVLELEDGSGTVTATLSGFGADMDNPDKWVTLDPETVTLANLSDVDVTEDGLVATPDYVDVAFDAGSSGVPQIPQTADNAAFWGAFPQDFGEFQQKTGQGPYWYTSGGQTDRAKVTTPLTVRRGQEPVQLFSDVPMNHQFFEEIAWMAGEGITTGLPDGSFRPTAHVERQAMAAFLYRNAGEPDWTPPTTSPFKDVPTNHQFYKEITWLADQGITTGLPDGTFRPNGTVERQAMAAFIYRFAGEPAVDGDSSFSDVPANHQFYDEITWLADNGISTGLPDGTFRPTSGVERQATAAFLFRYDGLE